MHTHTSGTVVNVRSAENCNCQKFYRTGVPIARRFLHYSPSRPEHDLLRPSRGPTLARLQDVKVVFLVTMWGDRCLPSVPVEVNLGLDGPNYNEARD